MKLFKYSLTILLSGVMFFYMNPIALSENNASVLQSIGHTDTDTVTLSVAARTITLTVPYAYMGNTVDLSNGLDITYNESLYKHVVAVPESVATVHGAAVLLTVTYHGINDETTAEKSQTIYSVYIERGTAKDPAFSGIIHKTGVSPGAVSFSASDFMAKYEQNDGEELDYVAITGSNQSKGKLLLLGTDYELGSLISVSQLDKLTFLTAASGTVSYDVAAYTASDTFTPVGTAVLTISVSALAVPVVNSAMTKSVSAGFDVTIPLSSFVSCCDLKGGTLGSVEITPTNTTYGTWYAGGMPFTGTTTLSNASDNAFVFTGTAVGIAAFKWRIANEAGYSQYGTGSITVSPVELVLTSYKASSDILKGATYSLAAAHFGYSPVSAFLKYVKLSTIPPSADGYLCLSTDLAKSDACGYPAIVAGKALTKGAVIPYDYLKFLRLVTKSTTTSNSLSFTWTATADSVASKATWASAVSYTVDFVAAGTVSYDTDLNLPVTFHSLDFSEAFDDATGETLSYVTFTLPAATSGKLYYNYDASTGKGTAVAAGTKYYRSGTPDLSNIVFVPVNGYTGTVTTSYNAYSSDGAHVTGTLEILVFNKPGGTVYYTTDKNFFVSLDAKDFKTAFQNASGATLSYVKFSLPSSSYGKLYYQDESDSDRETVSSGTKYYVYDSPYLSYVYFMPRNDYTGDVNISFTGYTSGGTSYKGKLKISVVDSPAGIVMYSTNANSPVALDGDDFAEEFLSVSGSVLSYVNFKTAKAANGVLYYNYSALTGKGTAVSASAKYYCGSDPDLSDLTFVPASGVTGTVTIPYTVSTAAGTTYAGKLKIAMEKASAGNITCTTHVNSPVTLNAERFSSQFTDDTGGTLAYVKFILPAASYGKLNYNGASASNAAVSADIKYYRRSEPYLSGVTFVPYTDYVGEVTIPYIGYDTEGEAYTGDLIIIVDGTQFFGDVDGSYSWAREAIQYLSRESVVKGTGDNRFSPQDNVLRGDFMLMLCRAFALSSGASNNFPDVPKGSYYYNAIASAKALGVATGSEGNFYPDESISRQDAMVMLVRTLAATGDMLTPGSNSALTAFSDRNDIDDYAVGATAALVKAGIVTGSGNALNPKGKITRAEMAVILYRILTR